MRTAVPDRAVLPPHEALLRPVSDHRPPEIESWSRSALNRGHRLVTLAAPPGLLPSTAAGHDELTPDDVHPASNPVDLVRRALEDGFDGLSILIWADRVVADTSAEFHSAIESTLTDLCHAHPVSVLCVYDRPGTGTTHVDMAVAHHAGGLHEKQCGLRDLGDTVQVSGEIDMTNLDVFRAVLGSTGRTRGREVCVDLTHTRFLSAGAARALHQQMAAMRSEGGRLALRGAQPSVRRVLHLLGLTPAPED